MFARYNYSSSTNVLTSTNEVIMHYNNRIISIIAHHTYYWRQIGWLSVKLISDLNAYCKIKINL